MKKTIKELISYTVPAIAIMIAFLLLGRVHQLSPAWVTVVKLSPYMLLTLTMLLSYFFNKSQIFFAALVITMSHFFLVNPELMNIDSSSDWDNVYMLISIIIPINIIIFSWLKERGIFTLWGKVRLIFIGLQFASVIWIIKEPREDLLKLVSRQIVGLGILSGTPIPQIAIAIILIAAFIRVFKKIRSRSILDTAFLGIIITLTIGLHFWLDTMAVTIFFAASGLILIVALLQTSYSMAYMDELTGLPARRALREALMKLGSKYVIAMMDIDHFKKFNDKYGHDIGDEVLKLVAASLDEVTGGGKAYRYGGEEFTIIFPNKRVEDVLPHLEELRERVSKKGYNYNGKGKGARRKTSKSPQRKLFVTISIGVAEKNTNHKSPQDVLKTADTALYRAKKKGRNCVSK